MMSKKQMITDSLFEILTEYQRFLIHQSWNQKHALEKHRTIATRRGKKKAFVALSHRMLWIYLIHAIPIQRIANNLI
ncbi:hypothetical protein ABH966_005397 [Lysinibacillus sp. RC46]